MRYAVHTVNFPGPIMMQVQIDWSEEKVRYCFPGFSLDAATTPVEFIRLLKSWLEKVEEK